MQWRVCILKFQNRTYAPKHLTCKLKFMVNKDASRHRQSGNVLWFILLAVALIAMLTMVLSRSGSRTDQTGDIEQIRVKAGQILRTTKSIEAAIQDMRLRGVSENEISFENTSTSTDYTNAKCSNTDCRLFHVGGAGLSYTAPPSGANNGDEWIFTGANNVGTTAGPMGTTAARSGNDLIMLLPNANTALCKQINRELGVGTAGTIPTDATGISTAAFTGTFVNSLTILDGDASPFELNNQTSGCFTDTNADPDVTYFYAVLLAR